MSYHQRPHELRLAISSEAEALIFDLGGEVLSRKRLRLFSPARYNLASPTPQLW
jgi:hypothetical protein